MKICFINFQGKHLDVLRFLTLIISIRDMSIYINIYLTWILSKVLGLSKISHSCCMQSSTDEGIEHATYMVSAFSACSIASKVCHKLRSCLMYCCLCWCLWNLPLVLQLYFFVLAPSRFMMEFTHLTWSRMKHNGCTFWKKSGFLPAVTTSMVQEGALVEFLALSERGKCLGRSRCLQWINTWCKARVADRSLAPTTHTIRRSKDFKAGERSIWQGAAKRMSLGGFKPSKGSLKLVNDSMMESKHRVFNLMVHRV